MHIHPITNAAIESLYYTWRGKTIRGARACIMTSSFSLLVKLCLFVLASAVTACCSKKFTIEINNCVNKWLECLARLWKITRSVSTSLERQPLSWRYFSWSNTWERQRRLQQNFSPPLTKRSPLLKPHAACVRKRQLLTDGICFNRAIGVQFNAFWSEKQWSICDLHRDFSQLQLCFCWALLNRSVSVGETPASIDMTTRQGCILEKFLLPAQKSCKIQSLQKQGPYRAILVFFESND